MNVTIYDVAEKAGVSISTVSRVLNNNPNVLEDTRQKVLKAIDDLQFKPNPIARGLVVKQTNLIEVFFSWAGPVFSMEGYQFNLQSAWYVGLLNGINDVVQEKQYGLLINTISGVFDPQEVYRKVSSKAVDGVLLVSPYLEEKDVLRMMNQRIPMVLIGYRTNDPGVDFVDSDNKGAAVQMVDYLVGLGHKKIACIAGQVKTSRNAADRLEGFKEACLKHGLALADDYIAEGDFLKPSGAQAMRKLMALADRPTAVFASNDLMGLGAWDAAEEMGLTVGKDVALVGFDDITESNAPPYSLTTVRQDYRTMSVEATRMLIDKIGHPDNWKPKQVLVPTQLVVRQSSGSQKK
ncbi:MAG TPA: LacI family DNA-binding transcriptional regulator [bacterium]|nr:LacI family DNA-binding transcriptional regulator [bacterium]